MRIKFLVPQLSQPRCIKRIQALQNAGYDAEVYGFDNGLYSDNIKDIRGVIHSFKIDKKLSRKESVKAKLACVRQLCKSLDKDDIVYIFGIELALIYRVFLKRNKVIYEQADLNYTKLPKKWLVNIFKAIDKWLIAKSSITVLTSQGFIDYLYGENANRNNIVLIENKVNSKIINTTIREKVIKTDCIKFGFVGLIRYPRTLLTFAKVIGEHFPNHEFHFYGIGEASNQAIELCNNHTNLFYHGAFKNPEDLPMIYNEIDMCVVCYDSTSLNVRIAEPNKLYESIFFHTPIIVSKDTFLAKKVENLGVGYSVKAFDEKCVEKLIKSFTNEKLMKCIMNMKGIDKTSLFDNANTIVSCVNKLI